MLASSTTNELEVQIQRYIKQAHRQSAQIDDLSAKLTSQRKLVNLCKDQEKIITRLEDLFSKTRIDIDKSKRFLYYPLALRAELHLESKLWIVIQDSSHNFYLRVEKRNGPNVRAS